MIRRRDVNHVPARQVGNVKATELAEQTAQSAAELAHLHQVRLPVLAAAARRLHLQKLTIVCKVLPDFVPKMFGPFSDVSEAIFASLSRSIKVVGIIEASQPLFGVQRENFIRRKISLSRDTHR